MFESVKLWLDSVPDVWMSQGCGDSMPQKQELSERDNNGCSTSYIGFTPQDFESLTGITKVSFLLRKSVYLSIALTATRPKWLQKPLTWLLESKYVCEKWYKKDCWKGIKSRFKHWKKCTDFRPNIKKIIIDKSIKSEVHRNSTLDWWNLNIKADDVKSDSEIPDLRDSSEGFENVVVKAEPGAFAGFSIMFLLKQLKHNSTCSALIVNGFSSKVTTVCRNVNCWSYLSFLGEGKVYKRVNINCQNKTKY